MRRSKSQRGFTLIETLVSLSIAALAVSGFYQALSTGLFMERRSGIQADQMLVATQLFERVGIDLVLRTGAQETGTSKGLEWSLTISEGGTSDMQLGPIQANEVLFVYVTVESPQADGVPLVLRGIRYRETPI